MVNENNSRTWKKVGVLWPIVVGIVIIAVGWGTLRTIVAGNCKKIEKHDTTLRTHESAVVEIRSDVRHIREDITEQKTLLKEIRDEVRK